MLYLLLQKICYSGPVLLLTEREIGKIDRLLGASRLLQYFYFIYDKEYV